MHLNWKSLKYNLTGCSGDFALSPVTAFVGDPMVGKTTALRAIRLAMTGDKGIIGGRDASQFLSRKSDAVLAELSGHEDENNAKAVWTAENINGALKGEMHSVFPKNADFNRYVLAPNKLRTLHGGALERALGARFGGGSLTFEDEKLADLLAELSAEHSDKPAGSLAAALEVAEWCSKEIKALGRQKGATKRAAEAATEEILDVEALRNQLADKETELEAAEKELEDHPRMKQVRDEIRELEAKLKRLNTNGRKVNTALKKLLADSVTCGECGASRPSDLKKAKEVGDKATQYIAAIDKTKEKIAKLQAQETVISKAQGTKVELIEDDIDELKAKIKAAKAVKSQTKRVTVDVNRRQNELRELREEITASLDQVRVRAIQEAEDRVSKFSIDGIQPYLMKSPLRWGVFSRGAARWASASGSQLACLDLALTLAWSDDNARAVVIADDEHFTNFSRQQTMQYLNMLVQAAEEGLVSQVFVARPTDRKDIPKRYTQIKIGD